MMSHDEKTEKLESQKLEDIATVQKVNKNEELISKWKELNAQKRKDSKVDFKEFKKTQIAQDITKKFADEAIQLGESFDKKIAEEIELFNKIEKDVIESAEEIKSKLIILSINIENYQKKSTGRFKKTLCRVRNLPKKSPEKAKHPFERIRA